MFAQSNSQKDTSVALMSGILPRMPWRVAEVQALEGFRLNVRFIDGLQGIVNMDARVHSPVAGFFAKLADASIFSQIFVEHGAVTWPGEIDLAPDVMHAAIERHGEWLLR